MKLRLGAAVLTAALIPLTALTGAAPARAGTVDVTPPEVGSCHQLTWHQVAGQSDARPSVPCTDEHDLVTTRVITFDTAPDWTSDELYYRVARQCYRSINDFFGGDAKDVQLSTYSTWFFYPTAAQQEAGAAWARCDLGLHTTTGRAHRDALKQLPTDGQPALGTAPLDDSIARCRLGGGGDFAVTTCDHAHRFRAVRAFRFPGATYPGLKRITHWSVHRCDHALGDDFGYFDAPTKFLWSAHRRFTICFTRTRS